MTLYRYVEVIKQCSYAQKGSKMAINLKTALKIAGKKPTNYEIYTNIEKGYTNVIRHTKEKSGKYAIRVQTFDTASGELKGTVRRINDSYSIYSNPSSGLLGLQYFTKVDDPSAILGYRINRVYVETNPKNIGDIRAFYKSQEQNMK